MAGRTGGRTVSDRNADKKHKETDDHLQVRLEDMSVLLAPMFQTA